MKGIFSSLLGIFNIFGSPSGDSFEDVRPGSHEPRSAKEGAAYEKLVSDLQSKPMPIDPEMWNNANLD